MALFGTVLSDNAGDPKHSFSLKEVRGSTLWQLFTRIECSKTRTPSVGAS